LFDGFEGVAFLPLPWRERLGEGDSNEIIFICHPEPVERSSFRVIAFAPRRIKKVGERQGNQNSIT